MLTDKKIVKFINEEKNIELMSKEIAEIIEKKANKENIEYSFDISEGKIKEQASNTYFVFDTEEGTKIDEFKKYLFDSDLKDLKEDSKEEKFLFGVVRNFLLEICKKITYDYRDILENTIRRVVLGNKADKKIIPLNTIEAIMIDVSDFSSIEEESKYLLQIFKDKNCPTGSVNVDEVVLFSQKKREETGMNYDEILKIEKEIGNPLFEHITGIKKGRKFLNEITLYMYVDYSLNESIQENIIDAKK